MKFDELCSNILNEFAKPAVGYKLTKQAEEAYSKDESIFKDLNNRESAVLGTIFVNPGSTRKQVADSVGQQDLPLKNPQTTGFIIKSLVNKGLVELTSTLSSTPSNVDADQDLEDIDISSKKTEKPISDDDVEATLEDIIYNAMKQIGEEVTVGDLIDIVKSSDLSKKYRDPEDENAVRYTVLKKDIEKTLTQMRKDGTIGINVHVDPVKYYLKDVDDSEEIEVPELEFEPEKKSRRLGLSDIEKELGYGIEHPEKESLPWDFG